LNRSYIHNSNPFHLGARLQAANVSFGGDFLGGTRAENQIGVLDDEIIKKKN
jgi:hypothetical protein